MPNNDNKYKRAWAAVGAARRAGAEGPKRSMPSGRGSEGPKRSVPSGRQWYYKQDKRNKSADYPAGSETYRTFAKPPKAAGWKRVTNKQVIAGLGAYNRSSKLR